MSHMETPGITTTTWWKNDTSPGVTITSQKNFTVLLEACVHLSLSCKLSPYCSDR